MFQSAILFFFSVSAKTSPKFTDDTVFTNALAESLLHKDGYDPIDFAKRYLDLRILSSYIQ